MSATCSAAQPSAAHQQCRTARQQCHTARQRSSAAHQRRPAAPDTLFATCPNKDPPARDRTGVASQLANAGPVRNTHTTTTLPSPTSAGPGHKPLGLPTGQLPTHAFCWCAEVCTAHCPPPLPPHLPLRVLAVLEAVQDRAALTQLHHQVDVQVVLKHILHSAARTARHQQGSVLACVPAQRQSVAPEKAARQETLGRQQGMRRSRFGVCWEGLGAAPWHLF
jgi:hypothetical protein